VAAPEPELTVAQAPEQVVAAPEPELTVAPAHEPAARVPEALDLEPEPELDEIVDESVPLALGSSASESAFVVEAEEAEVRPSPSANKRARPREHPSAPAADDAYDAAIAAVLATADAGRPRRERRAPTRFVPGEI
jgi:hypothetical protein